MRSELTPEQIFWKYVTPDKTDRCWEWQSESRLRNGYGFFTHKGKRYYAHRFSWQLHNGKPLTNKMFVCHSCDNKKCCNPHHLWVGSNQDNIGDMVQKNRNAHGEKSGHAILQETDIAEIRHLAAKGIRYKELADHFGVSEGSISDVVGGRTWKHITSPPAFRKNYKPNNDDIAQMQTMIMNGMSYRAVGRMFNTSHHVVRRAIQNAP